MSCSFIIFLFDIFTMGADFITMVIGHPTLKKKK